MSAKRARSILFLSADLVGSTSHKQTDPEWQVSFLSFYAQYPRYLDAAKVALGGKSMEFKLWKAIGDEIVYEVEVRSEKEIARAVRIWLATMDTCEDEILHDKKLALKGSAFIATFPGPDSEVAISRHPRPEDSIDSIILQNDEVIGARRAEKKYQYDYMGPSIDIGFRVASLATRRHFTMTVEVTRGMARDAHDRSALGDSNAAADMDFMGLQELKGVWDGRSYPVFALDREHHNPVNDALASLTGTTPEPLLVLNVCKACAEEPRWPSGLYLPLSPDDSLQSAPEDAMRSARVNETLKDGFETVDTENAEGADLENSPPLD